MTWDGGSGPYAVSALPPEGLGTDEWSSVSGAWSPVTTLQTKAQGDPWLAILRVRCWEELASSLTPRGRRTRAPCVELSWTLPRASLPEADFNLSPFAVINHNYEYNSFP